MVISRLRVVVRCLVLLAATALTGAGAHAAPPLPGARGLLFRVEAPGRPPSWIFGTLRSNDPRVTRVPAIVADAMDASRQFAPEMSIAPAVMPGFASGSRFDDARRLSDYVDAATLARIRFALGAAAPEQLDRLKPWAVLLLLRDPGSEGPGLTLDALLLERAGRRKMAVIALELVEEQVASLDTFPIESQVAIVRHTLDHLADLVALREAAIDAWLARDLDRLVVLAGAPSDAAPDVAPHFAQQTRHLVVNRTVQMAHRLFLPLRAGGVFVAVGALHLPGRDGLLALLRAQGYRIRRVYRRAPGRRRTARREAVAPAGVKYAGSSVLSLRERTLPDDRTPRQPSRTAHRL